MNLEVVEQIVHDIGKFFEVAQGQQLRIFMGSAPEGLLPYPKLIIMEALEIAVKVAHEQHNEELQDHLESIVVMVSMSYTDDTTALKNLFKRLKDPESRKVILGSLAQAQNKRYQELINQF